MKMHIANCSLGFPLQGSRTVKYKACLPLSWSLIWHRASYHFLPSPLKLILSRVNFPASGPTEGKSGGDPIQGIHFCLAQDACITQENDTDRFYWPFWKILFERKAPLDGVLVYHISAVSKLLWLSCKNPHLLPKHCQIFNHNPAEERL